MLQTNRCILTKPQQQDYENVKSLYMNAEVRKYLGGPVEEQEFRTRIAAKLSSNTDSFYWIIRQASDKEFIGSVSLGLHHDGINTEISYQLLPKWWGNGYATEVLQGIIKYAFEDLGLAKVVAETQTANIASCRLLEKLGMQLETTIERFGAEQAIFSITNINKSTS